MECMSKQQTFAGLAWKNKGKLTRRERFLSEMNQIIPWSVLMGLIEPPEGGTRSAAAGIGEDAADLSAAALVRSV
jgi:hypothetical protein